MDIIALYLFACGIAFQAVSMLGLRWERGDLARIGWTLFIGLGAMVPGKNEDNYDIRLHLLLAFVLMALMFTAQFAKRLLSHIGARTLIALNMLFLYVAWPYIEGNIYFLAPIGFLTLLTLLNGFADFDKHFGFQVALYAWYATMITGIGVLFFAFGDLIGVLGFSETAYTLGTLEAFLLGTSFLYILSNFFFVINLTPIPLRKRQSFASRMVEVKAHMELLATGYVAHKEDFAGNALAVVLAGSICFINFHFQFLDNTVFIPLALSLIPFLSGTNMPTHDGVGNA